MTWTIRNGSILSKILRGLGFRRQFRKTRRTAKDRVLEQIRQENAHKKAELTQKELKLQEKRMKLKELELQAQEVEFKERIDEYEDRAREDEEEEDELETNDEPIEEAVFKEVLRNVAKHNKRTSRKVDENRGTFSSDKSHGIYDIETKG